MKDNSNKNALTIGVVCIVSYLANYYLRHILSVLTPELLESGKFSVEHIGLLSSVYMIFYAAGQLLNGFLGDFISPRKMAPIGIAISGLLLIIFPFINAEALQIVLFAAFGFSLSMVRGPFMKIIAENAKPNQARIICIFFSFASFAGPLIASLFAVINNWHLVFIAAGGVAVITALISYAVLTVMERHGKICCLSAKSQGFSSVLEVFKIEKFGFYMIIAALVEIAGIAVSFWIPTFLTDSLHFDKITANTIFTVISLARSLVPFAALAIFRAINERDVAMMRVSLAASTVLFCFMLISQNRYISLLLMLLALMSISCTSALLWSIYIPGLGKTGRVSSVNGILDCTGYVAAAAANMLFANLMSRVGWNTVIIIWASLGLIGIAATFTVPKRQ